MNKTGGLRLFDSVRGAKVAFEPIQKNVANAYVCGITPHSAPHVGHARAYINWDVLWRYLDWLGYEVRVVQNFTDVDDKIIAKAALEGIDPRDFAVRHVEEFAKMSAQLNLGAEFVEYVGVRESMPKIIEFVGELVEKGVAYERGGSVWFDRSKADRYGRLAGDRPLKLEDRSLDFALWKAAKPGEPAWDSPWGAGRPGWHVECSAIARSLGKTLDIHAGGSDLMFPHHNNEIAQSESANGAPLANHWLHNGMVRIDGRKMSKSSADSVAVADILGATDPNAVRLWVLQGHYRKPLEYSSGAVATAESAWRKLARFLGGDTPEDIPALPRAVADFAGAMDDDLNTAKALSVLFALTKDTYGGAPERRRRTARELAGVLGFAIWSGGKP